MPSILTTLSNPPLNQPQRTVLDHEIHVFDRRVMSKWQLLTRLIRAARHHDAVVLDGSVGLRAAYVDVIAAGLIARRRNAPVVVLADCTWKRGRWWLDRLACRLGIRAVDACKITYCVLSTEEIERFPSHWGVNAERVAFTPWCYTLPLEELNKPGSEDGGVFAGGNSMRDYTTLIEAAHNLPAQVTIAANFGPGSMLPSNVRVGSVSHSRFVELMHRASVVVVPLQQGAERSAGQQTYLNAMAMGKAVVVTDSPGARDYILDRKTGIVVPPGMSKELAAAIRWVLNPANQVEVNRMRERARIEARDRFSPADYADSVLNVVRTSIARYR